MFEDQLIPEQEALTNLAYWYPILQTICMRVPKTIIVHRGTVELLHLLDGNIPKGFDRFEQSLRAAMDDIGYPCFLRTGMTSDKHDWKNTCYITEEANLKAHITALVEASCMANIAGLPFNYDFWVVRKLIPTKPVITYFNGMPIAMEVRAFIKDGKMQCVHPYWPAEVFENADDDIKQKVQRLQVLPDQKDELYQMIAYIGRYFSGHWSVDFLQDDKGKWWCTDMATGERSYHYPKCKHAEL